MNQELPDSNTFITQTAVSICRLGLRVPVLTALDTGPLFTFLGSQFLWVAQPALSLFLPSHKIRQTADLLNSPEAVADLTRQLEAAGDS